MIKLPLTPKTKAREHPEDDLAMAVKDFLDIAAPDLLWFAIPNGGKRNVAEAARLKKMGVLAGVWDCLFILPSRASYGWTPNFGWIELKDRTNTLTKPQKDFRDRFMTLVPDNAPFDQEHNFFAVCRSVHDVQVALEDWGVKLRGTVS